MHFAALRFSWLAHPNQRSSHVKPTPTLGGLGIVLTCIIYLIYLHTGHGIAAPATAMLAAGVLLGLSGLIDDLRDLGRLIRLVIQLAAASVIVWWLPDGWHPALMPVLVVGLVWHTNLYNFMDGIDGIAGVQCLVFCTGAQVIGGGIGGWAGDMLWLLNAAVLGFLLFNWPPARIFMGDVGSGFLGVVLGGLALNLATTGDVPLVASIVLLAGFWFDATYTLLVRVLTGQPFTQAHRSHLYQRLSDRYGHRGTTAGFVLFAALWLLPLAFVAAKCAASPMTGADNTVTATFLAWLCVPVAVLPLAVLARRFRAGEC